MALLSIAEISPGDSYSEEVVFNEETLATFINLTNDIAGIHVNRSFSAEKGFTSLVVHGFLLAVRFSRILGMELPGENSVIGSIQLNFHAPVYVRDKVKYTVTVKRILNSLGAVLLSLKIQKSDGTICVEGETTCAFKA